MFLSRLSKVRMEQMGPLCTASLEQGSYQRAYEYIVRYTIGCSIWTGINCMLRISDTYLQYKVSCVLSSA